MKTTVYLLRHGDCRQDDVKRYVGQADLPLNGTGRAQALAWRAALAALDFDAIYCSDLSRSIETAYLIAKGRKEPVQPLAKLREIHLGGWDGLSFEEVRRLYPAEYEKRGANLVSYRTPAGECFADVAARVIPLFEEMVARRVGENIMIVGHAGVNSVLLCHILGMPLANLFRFRQDYGCLNVIECDGKDMSVAGLNISSALLCRLGQGDEARREQGGYAVGREHRTIPGERKAFWS